MNINLTMLVTNNLDDIVVDDDVVIPASLISSSEIRRLYNVHFKGDITKEEAISLIKKRSRNYAKRQYTFFNNQFEDINWFDVDKMSYNEIINTIL